MAFQQLYYTSCEDGLAGYGGYQFNAVTPRVSPAIMREVEDRTVYEPPRSLLNDTFPDEPEAYPVAFSHGVSESTDATITAHVVFAGVDYSGRPGNYFAHALVTGTPDDDFAPLLPVELWGAELWRRSPVDHTDLPELPGPPPRGVVDRPGVQAFLDARKAERLLPELLSAVGRAMAGDRPVLLAGEDASENVWWIAAVSYLLGDRLGSRMTFTTYSHQPMYSRHHVIGVLADALPPDADSAFQLFDVAAMRAPGGEVHALAALLARAGVMPAAGLWQQATAFASGTEENFDDWLAPIAAAAALLGSPLTGNDMDALVSWLPHAADWLQARHADVVLGVALAQPDSAFADDRLRDLLTLARRLRTQSRIDYLERVLLDRAFDRLARSVPAEPMQLTGPAAGAARMRAARLLGTAAPATALTVLTWTEGSGVALADADLERYGHAILETTTSPADLVPVLTGRPAILRGLVARLATELPEVAEMVLSGPLGQLIQREDLAAHPNLTELWLLLSVERGRIDALRALDEISDVRANYAKSPRVDSTLLRRLWPEGCPSNQLPELLGIVTDIQAQGVIDWFAKQITDALRDSRGDDWLKLVQAVTEHPILHLLPEKVGRSVGRVARVTPVLLRARTGVAKGELHVFAELYGVYLTADDHVRRVLTRDVPPLLARADPLAGALRNCPAGISIAFCDELNRRLSPLRAEAALAARVFVALGHPDVRAQAPLVERLRQVFRQVHEWKRSDIKWLTRALAPDPAATKRFQMWLDEQRAKDKAERDERRSGLTRRLFGGGSEPPAKGS